MEKRIQKILEAFEKGKNLSDQEKVTLLKSVDAADQEIMAKNRELEIEAALERVRSRTMAMQKSDELKEVILVVYEQLVHLNIQIDQAGFVIDYKEGDYWNLWIADQIGVPSNSTIPYFDHPHWHRYNEAKEKGLDFFTSRLTFEEKNSFFKQCFETIQEVPEGTKELIYSLPAWAVSSTLLKDVCLYIDRFSGIPFSDSDNAILIRFGQVFQQTYTRFKDLERAESQTKEAKVEAALEKVRAHTMGMQSSNDLSNVAGVMFDQLRLLGGDLFSCGIVLCDKKKKEVEQWHSIPDAGMLPPFSVPVNLDAIHQYRYDQWKSGVDLFSIEIPEDKIKHHFELMMNLPSVKTAMDIIITKGQTLTVPDWEIDYGASFKYGYILVSALQPFEEVDILPRFTKVFEQAYTRFLDLQKAEEQGREALIEAALERVRSRTMAMHKSEELSEVAINLNKEFRSLGFPKMFESGYVEINEKKNVQKGWLSNFEGDKMEAFSMPLTLDKILIDRYKAWKRKEPLFYQKVSGNKLKAHLAKVIPTLDSEEVAEIAKNQFADPTHFYFGYLTVGTLCIISHEQLSKEQENLVIRFTKVFEQTYTRFLDLQKAEAQAREAKIEAALERVRSQAMAMQQSTDLLDIVVTMRTEFTQLGHEAHYFWHMGWLPEKYEKAMTSGDGSRIGTVMELPRGFHKNKAMLAWEKNKKPHAIFPLDIKAAVDYVDKMVQLGNFQQIDHNAPGPDDIRAIGGITFVTARTSHGEIGYSLAGEVNEVPIEDINLLIRFAGTFDLAHTRFLDLQKSEAQNRETQIELGLERVRAKTMAMQHSSELVEAANLLFNQVRDLGINAWSCGYNILNKDKSKSTCWMSSEDELQDPFPLYFTEESSFIEMGAFLKSDELFLVQELKEQAIADHYDYMKSLPELKETFQNIVDAGLSLPTYQINHLCKFSKGFLLFITYEPVPDAHAIFKRFTAVFEQTYTRFLDLQIAEEQAREAQIETALERVRASSMAMHKSKQLAETAEVLFEQFDLLGVIPDRICIAIFNDEKRLFELWATDQGGTNVNHGHDFFNRRAYLYG